MPGDPDSRRWRGARAVGPGHQRVSDGLGGVGAPDGELGGQQDLGASAVTAPGSAGRMGDPQSPDTAHGAGTAVAVRTQCGVASRAADVSGEQQLLGPPTHWPPRSPTTSPSMPVTVSYHARSGKGPIRVADSEFSAAAVMTMPTNTDSSTRR